MTSRKCNYFFLRAFFWVFVGIYGAIMQMQCCAQEKEGEAYVTLLSPDPTAEEFAAIKEKAEKGDAEAQLYLGVFYANGNIVEQDYSEAARWYLLAAENGNATAQRNLALLYDCGVGVERDYVEAVKWYRAAGRQAEPAALWPV